MPLPGRYTYIPTREWGLVEAALHRRDHRVGSSSISINGTDTTIEHRKHTRVIYGSYSRLLGNAHNFQIDLRWCPLSLFVLFFSCHPLAALNFELSATIRIHQQCWAHNSPSPSLFDGYDLDKVIFSILVLCYLNNKIYDYSIISRDSCLFFTILLYAIKY